MTVNDYEDFLEQILGKKLHKEYDNLKLELEDADEFDKDKFKRVMEIELFIKSRIEEILKEMEEKDK